MAFDDEYAWDEHEKFSCPARPGGGFGVMGMGGPMGPPAAYGQPPTYSQDSSGAMPMGTPMGIPMGTPGVDSQAEILNLVCGNCYSTIRFQPESDGNIIEFACPVCQVPNRFTYTRKAQVQLPPDFQVEYPKWWQKVPQEGDNRQLLPGSAEQLRAVQWLIDRTWKNITTRDRQYGKIPKLKVVQVQQNHNPVLWRNYSIARENLRQYMQEGDRQVSYTAQVQQEDNEKFDCLGDEDTAVNEFLLFHGTKPSACASICQSDFMVNLAGSSAGTLYGKGVYFGENSSKSDEYAKEEEDGIYVGLCAMLLCRVACGRMYYTDEVNPDHDRIYAACTGPDRTHHSVLGDRQKARNTYREFIVFDNDLAYPEYVIIYRREFPTEAGNT